MSRFLFLKKCPDISIAKKHQKLIERNLQKTIQKSKSNDIIKTDK